MNKAFVGETGDDAEMKSLPPLVTRVVEHSAVVILSASNRLCSDCGGRLDVERTTDTERDKKMLSFNVH